MKKEATSLDARREKRHSKYAAYARSEATRQKPQNTLKTAKKLFSFLSKSRILLAFVVLFSIIGTVLNIIGPQYLGDIIDRIMELVSVKLKGGQLDFSAIGKILATILAIYLSSSLTAFIQHFMMASVNKNLIFGLRSRLNTKLSRLPLSFYDSHAKGEILSRVTNDIDNIGNTFQDNFVQVISSVVSIVGVFVIMLTTNPLMTLVSVVSLPFGLLCAGVLLKRSRRYFRENWRNLGDLNGHIEEMYTGHKIVKIFNHEETAIEEFREINDELCRVGMKAQFISGTLMPLINLTSNLGYVLICIVGGLLIVNKGMSIGGITVFLTYSKLFMQPIVDLSNIVNLLQSSLASAERVFEVLDSEEEPEDVKEPVKLSREGKVELEHVNFRYLEDKPLIDDFSLKVNPGQLVAIVGPTGAGKTTIVNLLMRFYDVNGGSIRLDGVDIRDMPRSQLRDTFGMVLQDTWLFKGTIRDNIAYARQDVTEQELMAAAEAAKVDSFVSTLAEGYDTVLEENGSNLSQGQRQLLTIARAILADPDILILDEATSSVDTRTELQIQAAMKNLMKGRTNFVIAHRLSTIREADMILVMDNGSIVETGTHDGLMAKGGFYRELYNAQFAGCET